MHRDLAEAAALTDSMRMFKLGLEGGKPGPGRDGVQPEWFYKGDGRIVAAPGKPLESPSFALDGGEEPEIVGLYLIGPDTQPWRVGFALGNEFSDHVTEKQNYLYLAHSKLRACSIGPELLVGDLPADLRGTSRIRRAAGVVWEKPFLSGEANMCHGIENLERHHFKYPAFRRPGDVHAHFFGTSTLSFLDGFKVSPGTCSRSKWPNSAARCAMGSQLSTPRWCPRSRCADLLTSQPSPRMPASVGTVACGGMLGYSSGAPRGLIQTVSIPRATAPATSQRLEEWKVSCQSGPRQGSSSA